MRARLNLALALAVLAPALAGCQDTAAPTPQRAQFVAALAMPDDDPAIGGLSGLELSSDGTGFTALMDNGDIVTGTIARRDDAPQGLAIDRVFSLQSAASDRLPGGANDAEGLTQAPDGTFYIAFEIYQRVWRYRVLDGRAERLPRHPDFGLMSPNASLEALAIAPDGALYTMAENAGRRDWPTPVYRFSQGRWSVAFILTPTPGFRPVGADFGPDGALYLLERAVRPRGFRTRIRRITLPARGNITIEPILTTATGEHGNLEGLSVWTDTAGRIRLTMVSDNNFKSFMRSEIVEYVIEAP